jgi:spore germination protein KB
MTRETISKRQAICIITLLILGSSVIMGVSTGEGQDSWISLLIAAAWSIPVVLVYSRIMRLFPEKDLFEIIEALFGKVGGKILIAFFCWYAVHLTALVLRSFSEFIKVAMMPETPQLPIMILMLFVSAYLVKSGIESLGKWSIVVLPVTALALILSILFSLNEIDFLNIQPVFEHDAGVIVSGAFSLLSFPLIETVIFLGVAGYIKKTDSPKKILLFGILTGSGMLLLIMLRNIEVLGPAMAGTVYYPSFVTARVIRVGDFLSRIEGSISMNFLLCGITKTTLCLFVASKGASALFGVGDYKRMVMPVGLFSLALCSVLYKSTMEMYDFAKIYHYYALPFQVIMPLFVWIAAEIKMRKKRPPAKTAGRAAGRA